VVQADDGMGIN